VPAGEADALLGDFNRIAAGGSASPVASSAGVTAVYNSWGRVAILGNIEDYDGTFFYPKKALV